MGFLELLSTLTCQFHILSLFSFSFSFIASPPPNHSIFSVDSDLDLLLRINSQSILKKRVSHGFRIGRGWVVSFPSSLSFLSDSFSSPSSDQQGGQQGGRQNFDPLRWIIVREIMEEAMAARYWLKMILSVLLGSYVLIIESLVTLIV